MRFLITLIILAPAAPAPADTGFETTFGGPALDRGIHAAPSIHGGFVAVGLTASEGAGGEDVYLVKTDDAGAVEWSRTFGGEGDDNGWAVLSVSDGYVVAGFTASGSEGENDFYLVKTDLAGGEEWSRTFGGAGNDRCWSVVEVDRGGYLLAGETTSTGSGEQDAWLVRTDAEGNELWSRAFGGAKSDRIFAAVEAPGGGFVLAGQTFSEGAGDRDGWVVRTHADGELQWSRTFGGPASDVAHGVTATNDGAYLVTGYTTSLAEVDDDPYLIKIDGDGETLWTRVIPLDGINHTLTGAVAPDGGFHLVGFSAFPGRGPTAALLVKTDAAGGLAWHRNIQASNVGESFGYTVTATADGCVFAGHAAVDQPWNLDLLLVRVVGEETAPSGGGTSE